MGTRGRAATAAVVVALATLLLTGCDPYPVNGPADEGRVSVTIGDTGEASAVLLLNVGDRTEAQVRELAESLAPLVFPAPARTTVSLDDNSGAGPVATVHATGVYRPGPNPTFTLDMRPAAAGLTTAGFTRVDLDVLLPRVPLEQQWTPPPSGTEDEYWPDWQQFLDHPPVGVISMHPKPGASLVTLVAALLPLVTLVVGLVVVWRRPKRGLQLAGATAVLLIAWLVVVSLVQTASLAVSGWLPEPLQTAAHWIALSPVLLVPGIFVLFVISLVRMSPKRAADVP